MVSPARTSLFAVVLLLGCTGTQSSGPSPTDRATEPAPPPPQVTPPPLPAPTPNTKIPEPGPIQRGECPLAIVPGRALGPIQLGSTRAQLEQTGLPLTQVHELDAETMLRVGPYNAILCGEHVTEAWLDDLRLGPDCAQVDGKPIPRDVSRESFIALFSDCQEAPPRIGGAFTECADGGVRIGYGMGEFLQVRVGLRGIQLDDDCRHVLDDGSPVAVPPEELGQMLVQTIDQRELSDYWHPQEPGRRPLRIVVGELVPEPPAFNKFGESVVYVSPAEAAASDLPFFELTALHSTATTARLEFRYAVEGVVGGTSFRRRGDGWQMTAHELAER